MTLAAVYRNTFIEKLKTISLKQKLICTTISTLLYWFYALQLQPNYIATVFLRAVTISLDKRYWIEDRKFHPKVFGQK